MTLACPHCGPFKSIKTQDQLEDHLWHVHHEGWPEPASPEANLEWARQMEARMLHVEGYTVIDSGPGDCDDCQCHGGRQRIGRFNVCASCARARLHARELAA